MAKNQEKIWVLRELNESQVKSYGINIIMKRRGKWWTGLFVVLILWEIFIAYAIRPSLFGAVAMVAPPAVILWAFLYSANKAGKVLWIKVKAQAQPAKLEY